MPIESPRLDDLTYDRIVDDLVRRIPVYTRDWTDFNASDPGITLIQLFGHLGEQLGWRLNRLPESAHVELLKLLGITLAPATAARTRLALLLADPTSAVAATIAAGTQAAAKSGNPPPVFSTIVAADLVPAQVSLLVSTRNPLLYDVRKATEDATADEAPAQPLDPSAFPAAESEWLSVRWDGKKPKDKDLPQQPVALLPTQPRPHRYLWLGLRHNEKPDAGFVLKHPPFHFAISANAKAIRAEGMIGGSVKATHTWRTPGEAVARGSDYLVIGRPITQSQDPASAARAIAAEMTGAGASL